MKKASRHAVTDSGRRSLIAGIVLYAAVQLLPAQSPYIHRVYDFMPAPGQFVNELPEYAPGDTQADMNRKVEESIAGAHHNEGMVSLGGYGGYVVFGFDHEVANVAGRYDFRILGNAFYANANPNGEASREGGSCEPGIVMVSRDVNGNGLPDDPWYELAGSDYHRPQTVHGYEITYYRPDEDKAPVPHPSDANLNDIEYVRWTTNGHGDGYLYRNIYHHQSYFPQWTTDATLAFRGTKLADNYVNESEQESYYVQYASHWGYADNHPNTDDRAGFNIEWAVDANGHPVALPGIHFVRVHTGVNQYCGWLGETSTEIAGAEDLHLTGRDAPVPVFASGITLDRSAASLSVGGTLTLAAAVVPAAASNRAVTWKSNATAVATVSAAGTVSAHASGTAVIRAIANDGYYVAECRVTVNSSQPGPDPGPDPDPDPVPGAVSVTGVALDRVRLDLHVNETAQLAAAVRPATADNREVRWTTSDPSVAEITVNGLVLAFAPGETTVTATTVDGGYVATCVVHVTTVSATSPDPAHDSPEAYLAGGALRLIRLEGYDCTVVAMNGTALHTFRPASADERRSCDLPPGVYLLVARKHGEQQIVFRLAVNRISGN